MPPYAYTAGECGVLEGVYYTPCIWKIPATTNHGELREGDVSALAESFGWSYLSEAQCSREERTAGLGGAQDELVEVVEGLTPEDAEILSLFAMGYSADQIVWLLNVSANAVERSLRDTAGLVMADQLIEAGLISQGRRSVLLGRYARLLGQTLNGLVDARVMGVVVDASHCGLQMMLPTGDQVKLWFCADDQLDRPGWASLETIKGDFLYQDEMVELGEQVKAFLGRRRTVRQTARQMLRDIAEKAVNLLDSMDGDPDFEEEAELDCADLWENEDLEDQDDAPVSLNPSMQQPVVDLRHADWCEPQAAHGTNAPAGTTPRKAGEGRVLPVVEVKYHEDLAARKSRLAALEREVAAMPSSLQGFGRVCLQIETRNMETWQYANNLRSLEAPAECERASASIEPSALEVSAGKLASIPLMWP